MQAIPKVSPVLSLNYIGRLRFFKALSQDERAILSQNPNVYFSCRENEVVMSCDEKDDGSFYLILSGEFDVFDSSENFIRTMQPGQFFGEVSCILGLPRTATVVSKSTAILMRITERNLRDFPAKMREKIKEGIIGGLVKRVVSLNEENAILNKKLHSLTSDKAPRSNVVDSMPKDLDSAYNEWLDNWEEQT